MSNLPCVLTIAGSDSGGGAGIQADLKTFAVHKTFGVSVITAVTSQNTKGVKSIQGIKKEIVADQIDMVCEDFDIKAFKTGMLYSMDIIDVVSMKIKEHRLKNFCLDPVIFAGSGDRLLLEEAVELLIKSLFPEALIVTPNRWEAESFSKMKINSIKDAERSAKIIHEMGPKYVVIKGGHFGEKAIDVVYNGKDFAHFETERIGKNMKYHGAGCVFSASIVANLAKGIPPLKAIERAKKFTEEAIRNSFKIGNGSIQVNPLWIIK